MLSKLELILALICILTTTTINVVNGGPDKDGFTPTPAPTQQTSQSRTQTNIILAPADSPIRGLCVSLVTSPGDVEICQTGKPDAVCMVSLKAQLGEGGAATFCAGAFPERILCILHASQPDLFSTSSTDSSASATDSAPASANKKRQAAPTSGPTTTPAIPRTVSLSVFQASELCSGATSLWPFRCFQEVTPTYLSLAEGTQFCNGADTANRQTCFTQSINSLKLSNGQAFSLCISVNGPEPEVATDPSILAKVKEIYNDLNGQNLYVDSPIWLHEPVGKESDISNPFWTNQLDNVNVDVKTSQQRIHTLINTTQSTKDLSDSIEALYNDSSSINLEDFLFRSQFTQLQARALLLSDRVTKEVYNFDWSLETRNTWDSEIQSMLDRLQSSLETLALFEQWFELRETEILLKRMKIFEQDYLNTLRKTFEWHTTELTRRVNMVLSALPNDTILKTTTMFDAAHFAALEIPEWQKRLQKLQSDANNALSVLRPSAAVPLFNPGLLGNTLAKTTNVVFLDVSFNGVNLGKLVIALFGEKSPKAVANFLGLVNGVQVSNGNTTSTFSYKNNNFHRLVPGFIVQGGDVTRFDGSGGLGSFPLEKNDLVFSRSGLLATVTQKNNVTNSTESNGSQFFITFALAPSLQGKNTIFGEVIIGVGVLQQIQRLQFDPQYKPMGGNLTITDCGELQIDTGNGTKPITVAPAVAPSSNATTTPPTTTNAPASNGTANTTTIPPTTVAPTRAASPLQFRVCPPRPGDFPSLIPNISATESVNCGLNSVCIWGGASTDKNRTIPTSTLVSLSNCRSEISGVLANIRSFGANGVFPFPPKIISRGKYKGRKSGGDHVIFQNNLLDLPLASVGMEYREYTVPTPGAKDRAARRIVTYGPRRETNSSMFQFAYYTDDHYATFVMLQTV